MTAAKNRYLIVIGLLIASCVLSYKFGYGKYAINKKNNRLDSLPLAFGQWSGSRIGIGDTVYKILETDSVIVNSYKNGMDIVNLAIVYYPEVKVSFHSPEECNLGKGDKIENLKPKRLSVGTRNVPILLNAFKVIKYDGREELYYYAFKSGSLIGSDYVKLRLKMGLNLIRTGEANGALLIFNTPVDKDFNASDRILSEFILAVFPYIEMYV